MLRKYYVYISGVSHAHLRYISDISLIYLGYIWFTYSIYHVNIMDISWISQAYFRAIADQAYIIHILSLFQSNLSNLRRISGTCQV